MDEPKIQIKVYGVNPKGSNVDYTFQENDLSLGVGELIEKYEAEFLKAYQFKGTTTKIFKTIHNEDGTYKYQDDDKNKNIEYEVLYSVE